MTSPRKTLFSAVKNEAPFLLEWVAYHRAIGFDRIILVSNDSDDGTTELLDRLQAAGVVHHLHHSVGAGESPQGKAAMAANAAGLIQDGDWVIWLDADEFLNIHAGAGRIDDLLGAMGGAHAMLIPWRIFGDSGQHRFPGRFISPAFTGAADRDFAGNQLIKTLYRHIEGKTRLSPVANHRPHLVQRKAYRPDQALNAAGRPIDMGFRPNHRWLGGVEGKANFSIPAADYVWDLAQINHYMLRTREMFDLKAHRGRGFVNLVEGKPVRRPRHTPEFFAAQNRNEAHDDSILRHAAATGEGIAALLADPTIRAAHEAGLRLTAGRITAMREAAAALPAAPPTGQIGTAAMAATPRTTETPEEREARRAARRARKAGGLFVPVISMPAAESALLRRLYDEKDVILEYGSGGSTLHAAAGRHSLIMAVESDQAWSQNMRQVVDRDFPAATVQMHWADIGPTGKWGRPEDSSGWMRYHRYPLSVWAQPWFRHPDLILIDGRFRVGCLLAALFQITRPVTVLYDDYADRRHDIAAAEAFVRPVEVVGRMARFELEPTPYPSHRMAEITGLLSRPD